MNGRVVVIGSINVDETLPVASWPQPGETILLAGPVTTGLGGKGANQAVAAALAGAEVAFVGAVGADAGGARARDALVAHGVGVDHVGVVPDASTGRATILLHDDGENLILVDPGANAEVTASTVRAARDVIAAADVVLVQGEVSRGAIETAAALCRETGARFVLNLAPPVAVAAEAVAVADPLVVNDSEAERLGIDPAAPARGGAGALVVTHGGEGVSFVTSADSGSLPAHTVPVVDTTGAGDAFVGTLSALLARGAALDEACRAGSSAAAFAVTRPGASASYGSAGEVSALITALHRTEGTPA